MPDAAGVAGRRLAVVVIAAAALAGCAGIPQSGAIHVGHAPPAAAGAGFDSIPVLPPGPQRDTSPTALISGFLTAMGDSDDRYRIAREYLAPNTAWDSGSEIVTYNDPPTIQRTSANAVTVTAQRVGLISPRGSYLVAPATVRYRFTVVRRSGQWRIARVPGGALLSTDEAQRSLQPISIYYLNRTQDRLVPDPVLVPPQQQALATTLVKDLLAGPAPALAPAVTTAVPRGTTVVGTVPVGTDGVAEVNLSGPARDVSPVQLERLSAQIVWTLRQVSAVTAVRLLVNDSPLTSRDVPDLQSVRSWDQFDPSAPPTSSGALFVHGGEVGAIGSVPPAALAHRSLSSPTRSADGTAIAALEAGRTELVVGGVSGPLRVRLSAARISPPAFDPQGNVLVATAGPGGTRIVEVPPQRRPRQVSMPVGLRDEPIAQLAISRDGSRVAMVVGPPGARALDVATISSQPDHPTLHDVTTILPAAHDVSGVAWTDLGQIVTTLATTLGHRGVVETSSDGYQLQQLTTAGAPPAPRQVAAAPGQRILIAASGGIWALSGNGWVRRSSGRDPSYAG